mmetsp:Transcript_5597/g.12862  ORF Transcript_5597/g.12862 Transcript_5597/m.12862 type:complete len:86 (+) Transcript_5597:649-906(+)
MDGRNGKPLAEKKNKKRKDCMRNEELYGWEQPPKCDDVTRATTVQKETISEMRAYFCGVLFAKRGSRAEKKTKSFLIPSNKNICD